MTQCSQLSLIQSVIIASMRLMLINPWIRGTPREVTKGIVTDVVNGDTWLEIVSDTTQHYDRGNTRQVLTTSDRSLIQIAFPS